MAPHPDDDRPTLGFLLVRIGETVDRAFVAALAELGLKPRELRLLVLVDRTPRLSQRELSRQLAVDPGNLIATLDRLEADGVLRRVRDPADRRQRLVALTPRGQRLQRRAVRVVSAAEDELFGVLSPAQQEEFYSGALALYQGRRD